MVMLYKINACMCMCIKAPKSDPMAIMWMSHAILSLPQHMLHLSVISATQFYVIITIAI